MPDPGPTTDESRRPASRADGALSPPAAPASTGTRPPATPPDEAASTTPAPTPPAAGRFVLLEEIARGGMGVVYRATDTVLGREVAVKVLHERYAPGSAAARRFLDEARIAGQLQHPGVPAVHDLGTLPDGQPFLAMKLIKGRTLEELLPDRDNPAPERSPLVAVFEAVCQAVGYAHSHGVIHRDLKPANVMVGAFGEVQVMDWGLAKLLEPAGSPPEPAVIDETMAAATEIQSLRELDDATRAGSVLGTPAYMPPEQAIGAVNQIDPRSDVFGLGAVLCAILTGRPPYHGDDGESTRQLAARAKLDDAFGRLDACGAEPDLVALCKRCLAAERADRPAHAGEVARAVAGLRAAANERARRAELEKVRTEGELRAAEVKAAEQWKRRKVQAALGLSFTALVVLGGAFAWWQDRQAVDRRAERERAEADQRTAAERAVSQALEEAVGRFGRARGAGRDPALWAEARAAARHAEARAAEAGAPPDVRDRARRLLAEIEQVEKNGRLVAALLEIQAGMGDSLTPGGDQDFPGADARYARAFQEYGTDLLAVPPEAGADLLRNLGGDVRVELAAALDDWGYVRFFRTRNLKDVARLFQVTRLLDPDPVRNRIRDTVAAGEPAALGRLAEEIDPAAQPVQTVNLVAVYLFFSPGQGHKPTARYLQKAQPHHPGDFQINHNLAFSLNRDGRYAEAIPYGAAAIAVRPQSAAAWQDYAGALAGLNRTAEAIAAYRRVCTLVPTVTYARLRLIDLLTTVGDREGADAVRGELDRVSREAIRLNPKNSPAHVTLGIALHGAGDLEGATAAFREAVRLNPKDGYAHEWTAFMRLHVGDAAGALPFAEKAVTLRPQVALGHYYLGRARLETGDASGAAAALREALRLDPKHNAARNELRLAERMPELLSRLPDIAAGRSAPHTPAEAVEFARLCSVPFQRRYALAARLYEQAFAAEPRLADRAASHRYRAAGCAARAVAGKGKDDAPLSAADRVSLRAQALAWLRADLALHQKQAASSNPAERRQAAKTLAQWLRDPDLNGLQPGGDREGWAKDEATAWAGFWAEVVRVCDDAGKPPPQSAKGP